jgi:hypothetical protein
VAPFLRLRVWLRRGPTGERWAAAAAGALFLALLAWSLVPLSNDEDPSSATDGTTVSAAAPAGEAQPTNGPGGAAVGPGGAADAPAPAVGGVASGAAGASGGASTAAASAPGASSSPCSSLRATDQGVTDKEIFVAVPVINLVGAVGNETFGVRGNIEEIVNATAAAINAQGGIACRKLRVKVYKVSPIDKNEQHSRCIEIIGDKPFAVLDIAGYADAASRACFYQAKLPLQGGSSLSELEGLQNYPWAFGTRTSFRQAARNVVAGLAARGTFDAKNGFKKLGVVIDECDDDGKDELIRDLAKVGVKDGTLASYTMRGCGISTPNDISAAVVQLHNSGATHVFMGGNPNDMPKFVQQANGLQWRPAYLVSDVGSLTNPAIQANWPASFDGALGVTSLRTGERNSGVVAPLVNQCNDWMRKSGVKPSDRENDIVPLLVCDEFRLFAAAAEAAGPDNLVRLQLVPSLVKVGRLSLAHAGDAVYSGRKVFGGDFVRSIQWHSDCTCWKLLDRDFRPAV